MANLNIYRGASVLYTVGIDESTVYSGQVIGENKVTANFTSPVKLTLLIGDYIQHNGKTFEINQSVQETKLSNLEYSYSATFEGLEYRLYKKVIEHLGTADFTYFCTPDTLLDLIIDCMNTIDAGWQKGDVEVIEGGKFISFNNESCREGLTKGAEAFELEFSFDGKTINLVKTVGVATDIVFEYGQGNGLDSLIRKPVNDQQFGTRFIGYGSTQNIPADYRDGKKRLSFDPGYIDKNVATYGIIERPVVFDYIFPRRTGTITATPTNLQIVDSALDFNLNDVIVDGKAKIVFKSGDLQGNEFEIASYNNTTKTVTFNANVEENGYTLPNDTVKPAVGDTYTFIGIEMPESYITAAETELQEATEQYAEAFKNPFYAYDLPINEKFIRDNNLVGALNRGDRVRVIDTDMSVDTTLRVQAISYPLCNPGKISATINDTVSYTVAERILKTISKQKQQISVVYKNIAEVNRDLAIRQREFQNKVFDPDGYFDGGKIKPETIEALSIASGARSQQFTLSVIFQPNYEADPNAVYWSAGNLVHNTIDDSGIKIWSLTGGNRTDLSTLEVYYAYAKCLKDGNTGTIVFDTVARRVNDDPDFYYFLIGQLSSVIGGVRWPQFTYGTSTVNGRFLTTGRIQSADLQNYIDLDTNQFNFGNNISGIDYNVTTPNQLTVRGHIEATSGTIAGVEINAGNNFNLIGEKVKIEPEAGITVFNGGYLKIPSSNSSNPSWKIYVDENATGGTALPLPTGYLSTLQDVDISGRADGYVVYWDNASLKYKFKAGGSDYTLPIASTSVLGGVKIGSGLTIDGSGVISVSALGGVTSFNTRTGAISLNSGDVTGAIGFTPYNATNPDGYITASALAGYATESWATGNFAGLTGYNKSNWDTAFGWGNHASGGYALANGSNTTGTWGIDISGNATRWGNTTFDAGNIPSPDNIVSFSPTDGTKVGYTSIGQMQTRLGLGSAAYLNYGTGSTQVPLNSQLGSNAYTSTAYLPLSGGSLSGALKIAAPVNGTNKIDFGTAATNYHSITYNDATGALDFTSDGNERPYLFRGGNMNIGFSADQGYKLSVNGGGFFNGGLNVNGSGIFAGNVSAPTFIGALTGNASSATNWGGYPANFTINALTPTELIAYDGSAGAYRALSISGAKTMLGLGSNAYSSTAYLPLAGGDLTGTTSLKSSNELRFYNGSNNNWSMIRNSSSDTQSNLDFTTGVGIALRLNHDMSALFASSVEAPYFNLPAKTSVHAYEVGNDPNIGYYVYDKTLGIYRFVVADNGNILIGYTSDQGYRFAVNGTGYFGNSLTVDGGGNFNGALTASGQITAPNIKATNILEIPEAPGGVPNGNVWKIYVDPNI